MIEMSENHIKFVADNWVDLMERFTKKYDKEWVEFVRDEYEHTCWVEDVVDDDSQQL